MDELIRIKIGSEWRRLGILPVIEERLEPGRKKMLRSQRTASG